MKGKKYILLKAKIPVWLKYWVYKKGGVIPTLKNLYLGYSRQTQTTGANKLPFTARTLQSASGVLYECNSIGQVKITSTSTRGTDISYNTVDNLGILEAGNYTMKVIGSYENLDFKTTLSDNTIQLDSNNEYTFTINEDITDFRVLLTVRPNLTFDADLYITLAKGDTATTERYTGGIPAPNYDYPIEIENLTGNVPIRAGNKIIEFPLTNGQILYEDTMLTTEGILFQNNNIIFTGVENVVVGSILTGNAGCVYSSNLVAKNTTDSIIVKGNYAIAKKPSVVINGGEVGICSRQGENNRGIYFRIPSTIASTSSEIKSYLAGLYENNKPFIAEYKRTSTLLVPYTEAQQQAYINLCKYFEENTDLNNYIVGG